MSTTNPTTTIKEKNEVPSIDKQVQEDSKIGKTDEWGKTNDADIGQTVNFKTIVHAKKGAQNYVVHDKMSAGLTLDKGSIQVHVGSTKLQENTDYTVRTDVKHFKKDANNTDTTELDYTCDFEIHFTQAYLDKITENTDITITYSAVLNEQAAIHPDKNLNDTKLSYGDKSETDWVETETYTYKFDIVKTDSSNKLLTGAKFELYDAVTDGKKIALMKGADGIYRRAKTGEGGTVTEIDVSGGKATIKGLDGGTTYYLQETVAPNGYNKLAERQAVTIESQNLSTTMAGDTWAEGNGGVHIVNQTGALLPTTGGRGTTLIYIVGGLLVVGAGAVLFLRNRQSKQK